MKTSRQQVLDFIRSRHLVTAADISHALGMTQANARHHLEILKEQGLIIVVGQRPLQTKGRPARVFTLSHAFKGHNLERLVIALFAEIRNLNDDQCADLAKRIIGERKLTGSLTTRLLQAVQHLNQMNYNARWEAHADGARIVFNHCPYLGVVNEYPQLCQVDAFILEFLVGIPVKQSAKLIADNHGGVFCMFRLIK